MAAAVSLMPGAMPFVNGRAWRCDDRVPRRGAGPTIFILPSLGRSGRDYDEVARRLAADGFRVLRPEPRGVGRSRGGMDELTLHEFAADVAMVLDELKAGPVLVVGHAWGGQPAQMLAADRPGLVCTVVVAAASAGKLPPCSSERPYGRLRAEIDGAGDESLPETTRLDCLGIRANAWPALLVGKFHLVELEGCRGKAVRVQLVSITERESVGTRRCPRRIVDQETIMRRSFSFLLDNLRRLAACTLALSGTVATRPDTRMRIVVPFAPGSATYLEERWRTERTPSGP